MFFLIYFFNNTLQYSNTHYNTYNPYYLQYNTHAVACNLIGKISSTWNANTIYMINYFFIIFF